MANALILHGLFAEFPTQFLQGILEPNLIPSREFESRSREFGAFDDVRLAPQFKSPPSTQSPSSTQVGLKYISNNKDLSWQTRQKADIAFKRFIPALATPLTPGRLAERCSMR
jgi:hypothetical protein